MKKKRIEEKENTRFLLFLVKAGYKFQISHNIGKA
jgi:hypothetical protein